MAAMGLVDLDMAWWAAQMPAWSGAGHPAGPGIDVRVAQVPVGGGDRSPGSSLSAGGCEPRIAGWGAERGVGGAGGPGIGMVG